MSKLTELFTGGIGSAVEQVGKVADEFHFSGEEKAEFQIKTQEIITRQLETIQRHVESEISAKKDVMVAELTQGDNYTKRARPSIVYFGLAAILVSFVFALIGVEMPELPPVFWESWKWITSTYVVGRSGEKILGSILGRKN